MFPWWHRISYLFGEYQWNRINIFQWHNKIDLWFVYLQYQRWLYPVDKNRFDDGTGEFTESDLKSEGTKDDTNSKKNK